MKLIGTRTSPYGRKVRIVLADKRIQYDFVIDVPGKAATRVPSYNALGQIPVLLLDDGTTLFDSRVIVEYLDSLNPVGRLISNELLLRGKVRRWEALAEGHTEAAAAVRMEKVLPADKQNAGLIARKQGRVDRALKAMSEELGDKPWCSGDLYSLSDIAVGCTLGFFDWRIPDFNWRMAQTLPQS